ncbi:MAG: hypothetical protein RLZZ507_195 [Cyanobacteriota bacterium]|jgi:hypothetical protein
MSIQLCPVQSLIDRKINSDSFYSLISKIKRRAVQTTRLFNVRRQEAGVRSQESGVRSQESGVRSQES